MRQAKLVVSYVSVCLDDATLQCLTLRYDPQLNYKKGVEANRHIYIYMYICLYLTGARSSALLS